MDANAIREYERFIAEAAAERLTGAEIEETEEGPVLVCSAASPFGGEDDIGYRFTFMPLENGMFCAEILIFLFNGVPAEKFGDINRLIGRINPYIILGSLRLFEDSGSVLFAQGSVFDEETEAAVFTGMLGKTLELAENAAFNAGEYIFRYLNGEDADALLAEIDKED
ncbi:MAG: hypothetical protein IK990_20875 [Ruminiclostridium sp.]|nr:hypothetical protein [Ruminiclostridium sp.]